MRTSIITIAALCLMGCGLQEYDPSKPLPSNPDNPQPTTIKVPADSFYRGLAKWNDGNRLSTRHDMALIVNQLVKSKVMSEDDAKKIEDKFPGMTTDHNAMTPADSETLRNLK